MADHGDVWWTELNTHNPDKSIKFYSKLLGLMARTMSMVDMSRAPKKGEPAYTTFMRGDKPLLGCFTMEGEMFKNVPDHWFTYFAVNDVDKAAKDVVAAGGSVVREPWDIPRTGRIAIVKDVNGGVFGLGKPAPMEAPAASEKPVAKAAPKAKPKAAKVKA